jgi:hypothetical protein
VIFDLSLRRADHIRRYFVRAVVPSGWEVRFEEDSELRRRNIYQDWHRVERALALFEREVVELMATGWRIATDVSR